MFAFFSWISKRGFTGAQTEKQTFENGLHIWLRQVVSTAIRVFRALTVFRHRLHDAAAGRRAITPCENKATFQKMTAVLVALGLSETHTVALPGRIYRRQGNHFIISLKACAEQCMLSFWWLFFLPHSRLVTVIAIACVRHGGSLARARCVCIYIYLTFCFWQRRQKGQNNLRSEFCSAAFLRLPLFAVSFFFFRFSFRIFFPPLEIFSRKLTQRHKRSVPRGQDSMSYIDTHQWNSKGAAPLQWDHIPTLWWWEQHRAMVINQRL